MNRGVDFLLSGGKRKQTQPIHFVLDKMICFLKREVNIYLEFSLKLRKKSSFPEKKNVSN